MVRRGKRGLLSSRVVDDDDDDDDDGSLRVLLHHPLTSILQQFNVVFRSLYGAAIASTSLQAWSGGGGGGDESGVLALVMHAPTDFAEMSEVVTHVLLETSPLLLEWRADVFATVQDIMLDQLKMDVQAVAKVLCYDKDRKLDVVTQEFRRLRDRLPATPGPVLCRCWCSRIEAMRNTFQRKQPFVLARAFNWSDLLLPPEATNRSNECSSPAPVKFESASVVRRSRLGLPTSFNVSVGVDVELEKHAVDMCHDIGVKDNGAEDVEKCVQDCLMLRRCGSPKKKLLHLRRIIESLTNYAVAWCKDMTSHATTNCKMEFEQINPKELLVPLLAFVLLKAGLATAILACQGLHPPHLPSSHGRPCTSVEGAAASSNGDSPLTSSRESNGAIVSSPARVTASAAAQLCVDEGRNNRPGVQRHRDDQQEDPQHPRRDDEGPHFFSQLVIMRDFVPPSFTTQQEREDILLAESTLDMLSGWVLNDTLGPADMASRIDGPKLFM